MTISPAEPEVESLLTSKAVLYQTLTDFGSPGERSNDKISLVELLSKVAMDLKREGKPLPPGALEALNSAHADIILEVI